MLRRALPLLLVAAACATLLQPVGCNQTAHYALVQALESGTPRIDAWHTETCDLARSGGHWYAAKAPGLAAVTLPWYALLRAAGAVPRNAQAGAGFPAAMLGVPRRALWQAGLVGVVLPLLALLLCFRRVADELAPGTGAVAAVALGAGTLLLPFGTVYFAHVLAAALGFGAFTVLFLRRSPAAAGLLAGLAVCVDFPLALLAAALAVYAWRRAPPFVLGAVVGVVPLGLFNTWAFGNPLHLSYASASENQTGVFGLGWPRLHPALELLFSAKGLFVLSPLLAGAAVGLVLLWRAGRRPEAALAAGVTLAYWIYDAGYWTPFGGYTPGPRFLIPAVPLLALGLPPLLRAFPLPSLALALASVGAMVVATAAEPLLGDFDTGSWLHRWRIGSFTHTVVGGTGWLSIAPFIVLVAAGIGAALARDKLPLARNPGAPAAAVAAWVVALVAAPDLLTTDAAQHQRIGAVAVLVLATALLVAATRQPLAVIVCAPLLWPGFAAHTKWSLLVAAIALAAALPWSRAAGRAGIAPPFRRTR